MTFPNLRVEMVRKGITQTELAKMLGMSDSTLSLKLRGIQKLTFADTLAIKDALESDIPVEKLFEAEDD